MTLSHLEDYVESSVMLQMYNTTKDNFLATTAEKRTSMSGIMGSFDKHNRLNLGHCSKA